MKQITHSEIRMYRMGTGDCFVIKFFAGDIAVFNMMIDCGTWQGTAERLTPYITDLKKYVDNHLHLLVITHEHVDHVHVFDVCEELFTTNLTIDRVWMAWTEDEKDKKVKQWQKKYGEKKKALAIAADRLQGLMKDPVYIKELESEYNGSGVIAARRFYADAVSDFSELHFGVNPAAGGYKGGLKGMTVVKEKLGPGKIEYFSPGDIVENLPNVEGIRFYMLGPPLSWNQIKNEESKVKGESYEHNKKLAEAESFANAILAQGTSIPDAVLPFERTYESTNNHEAVYEHYHLTGNEWRKIDYDWLNSVGSLALRINSITNNLSLAIAIEFEDSGRVMLFPGDAEYGSWESWHQIEWSVPSRNEKVHLTEDLLNRTVFYKVAHHLSHHGTADRLGMKMINNTDLVSMATLDYNVISSKWLKTMPNKGLLRDLVRQTKGRLLVSNLDNLFYDLHNKTTLKDQLEKERNRMSAAERKAFKDSHVENELYYQCTIKA